MSVIHPCVSLVRKAALLLLVFLGSLAATAGEAVTSYRALIDGLESVAKDLESSKVLKEEFIALQTTHGLLDNEKNFRDFVRVRLAFELTRDSGLWQVRWAVTDQEPQSDAIWRQWQSVNQLKADQATAVAECDELSALFAIIARDLGVKKVGLFWPTWNHTVAVWMAAGADGKEARVVVPTSQVFLTSNATLGTKIFNPYTQKTIYPYHRKDVSMNYKIPTSLVNAMIEQAKRYGGEPSSVLQARRNKLSQKMGGS